MSAPSRSEVVATSPLVVLRLAGPEDAYDEYTWRRDPELARHHATVPLDEPFSEFLERFEAGLKAPDPSRQLYSIDDHEGRHVGSLMYYHVVHAGVSAEFGITIGHPDCRGRGFGYEATVAFLRYLWSAKPFRQITLATLSWNHGARRCFERAGFVETRRFGRDEQEFVHMETLRERWLLWDQQGRFPWHGHSNEGAPRS